MDKVKLPYGNEYYELPLENLGSTEVATPRPPDTSIPPEEFITEALDSPTNFHSLAEAIRGKSSAAVVIPDVTRYSGAYIYLPLIVKRLVEAGVREENITLFIALGIHRKMTEDEVAAVTGGLSKRLEVVQHDPDGNITFIGKTSRGTPVWINSRLLEKEAVIITGTASFHYFAGFGGGRKMLVPGLAGRETCYRTHFRIFAERGRHPHARPGILKENPVHEDMLEAASLVPVAFTLTTCVTPNKRIFAAFGGSLTGSHAAACELYSRHYRVPVKRRYPFVIASAGGYPKDINFIQSHKALDHAYQALLPGGVLILVARCQDGLGHEDFFPWFRFENLSEFERELRENYVIYGQTAYATLSKALGAEVILVSDLPEDIVRTMRITPASDLDEALAIALEKMGGRPGATLVIPEAGYVLPEAPE